MRFFASSIRATTLRQQTSNGLIRLWPGRDAHVEQFTGGVLRVRVALWPTACRFRTGHRLRLQDSSGADPRFSRTP